MTGCGEKLGPEPVNPVCSVKSALELTQTGILDTDGEVTGLVIMHARFVLKKNTQLFLF